jgi:hypothetical protein
MPFEPGEKDTMLDAITAAFASLHTGIPEVGVDEKEVSGGGPAYIRKAIAFNAASGGSKTKNVTPAVSFDVPAGATVFYVGLYDLVAAGTLLAWFPVNAGDVDGVGRANVSSDLIESAGHGLSADDRVTFRGPVGETLPANLDDTTIYYVLADGITTDDFKVSLTSGGAAIDITPNPGQVYFQKVTPEAFGAQGTLSLDSMTLKLEE